MATVEASLWSQTLYSTVYMQIDYTVSNGSITINSVKGKASSGGPHNNYTKTHTISFPGGSGTITTTASTFNSTSWQTWTLSGTTTFSSSGGTGALTWTMPSDGYYGINGSTFNFGDINIPSPIYTPVLSNISVSNVGRTSLDFSFTVTDSGGAPIATHYGYTSVNSSMSPWASSYNGTSGTIGSLTPNTNYYVQGYAGNGTYTGYTNVAGPYRTTGNPPVITSVVETPTLDSCELTISVTYDTNATWAAGLVEYGTTQSYGSSTPSNIIQGLNSGTLYYYRVTITDTEGRSGTYTGSFTTLSDNKVFYSLSGGSFVKRKLYISINGDTYKLVSKVDIIN